MRKPQPPTTVAKTIEAAEALLAANRWSQRKHHYKSGGEERFSLPGLVWAIPADGAVLATTTEFLALFSMEYTHSVLGGFSAAEALMYCNEHLPKSDGGRQAALFLEEAHLAAKELGL